MNNKVFELLPWLLGTGIAIALISLFAGGNKKFEDAALGEETSSYMAMAGNYPIHLSGVKKTQDSLLLDGWVARGKKPVVFFIGNSQTHGVNRMKPGDVNYVQLLHDNSSFEAVDLLANSIPNGNLQEFYLLYAHYMEILPIQTLVFPVFMDDLRETGVREFFFKEIVRAPTTILNDSNTIAKKITQELEQMQQQETANSDMAALDQTVQASSETYLNNLLNQKWPLWSGREQIRGNIMLALYKTRNTIFQITPQTQRKMVKSTYDDNMQALEAILRLAKSRQIRVIAYIPPLRSDVTPPYAPEQYSAFKQEVATLCNSYGAEYDNLDNIVPGPQWGMKASTNNSGKPEFDFMHFTAEGHRLLANALLPILKEGQAK